MIQGQHRFARMDNVVFGKPAAEAIAQESARRGAERRASDRDSARQRSELLQRESPGRVGE